MCSNGIVAVAKSGLRLNCGRQKGVDRVWVGQGLRAKMEYMYVYFVLYIIYFLLWTTSSRARRLWGMAYTTAPDTFMPRLPASLDSPHASTPRANSAIKFSLLDSPHTSILRTKHICYTVFLKKCLHAKHIGVVLSSDRHNCAVPPMPAARSALIKNNK